MKSGKFVVLIYFFVFSALLAFITPPFEAPDEPDHLNYINFVAQRQELPNQYQAGKKVPNEGHQFPLYYLLAAMVNRAFLADGRIDYQLAFNKNKILTAGQIKLAPTFFHLSLKTFSDQSDKQVFYLLRLLSILLGVVNVFFIYRLARIFLDERGSLFASFLVASLPQFAFMCGMINNDNLANLLATLSLYFIFKIASAPKKTKNYLMAGIFLGAGILTKKTILIFLPGMFVLLFALVFLNRSFSRIIARNSFLLFILAALISGWWLARNFCLYGELLGNQMEINTLSALLDKKPLLSFYFFSPLLPYLFTSFVGKLGWFDLVLPLPAYALYLSFALAASFGLFLFLDNPAKPKGKVYAALLFILCNFSGVVYYNLWFSQAHGRFLFPTISLIAILATIGWKTIINKIAPASVQRFISVLLILGIVAIDCLTIALACYFYWRPEHYL